ncbi:LOW QUALITY PROTEIN: uncharacterized protein LOC119579470 [Penaeus monodon]|uniref:LOW QUALITY PROTEIN: uncharacterized protein LOC119579470 n=1 Tax=Penaeus monodon TaxID=6687 RepID=UPI0018A6EF53|nr:LOW QUALITY PROTEIN: uncharacterized protein LOC119579470 [Penaeus monodon]
MDIQSSCDPINTRGQGEQEKRNQEVCENKEHEDHENKDDKCDRTKCQTSVATEKKPDREQGQGEIHRPETEKEESKEKTRENDVLKVLDCDVRGAVVTDKGEGAVLTSWAAEDLGKKGDNYLSSVKRVKAQVTIEECEEQLTYVAKVKMLFSDTFKEFSNMSFLKEHEFYTKLLPELNGVLAEAGLNPLRIPKFYHYSKSEEREIIMLEDLTARGFRMADRKKGLDVAHAVLVLQELARIHASSVLLQQKHPDEELRVRHKFLALDWTKNSKIPREDISAAISGDLLTAAGIAENSKGYEDVGRWLRELEPRGVDVFDEQLETRPPFAMLGHGDCWTNNFVFRYDDDGHPIEVMLLDLQLCRQGSPALDLQTLMYSSVNGALRRTSLPHFLQAYTASFDATVAAGGTSPLFTVEELTEEYNARTMYGVLMASMYIPLMVIDSEDAPDFTKVDDDKEFFADRAEEVVRTMDDNPLLGETMCSVFDEWIAMGLIS